MATSWKWNASYDLWFHGVGGATPGPAVSGGRVKQLKPLFPFTVPEIQPWYPSITKSLIYRMILSDDFPIIKDSGDIDGVNLTGILVPHGEVPLQSWKVIIASQRVYKSTSNDLDYTYVFCIDTTLTPNHPIT